MISTDLYLLKIGQFTGGKAIFAEPMEWFWFFIFGIAEEIELVFFSLFQLFLSQCKVYQSFFWFHQLVTVKGLNLKLYSKLKHPIGKYLFNGHNENSYCRIWTSLHSRKCNYVFFFPSNRDCVILINDNEYLMVLFC